MVKGSCRFTPGNLSRHRGGNNSGDGYHNPHYPTRDRLPSIATGGNETLGSGISRSKSPCVIQALYRKPAIFEIYP